MKPQEERTDVAMHPHMDGGCRHSTELAAGSLCRKRRRYVGHSFSLAVLHLACLHDKLRTMSFSAACFTRISGPAGLCVLKNVFSRRRQTRQEPHPPRNWLLCHHRFDRYWAWIYQFAVYAPSPESGGHVLINVACGLLTTLLSSMATNGFDSPHTDPCCLRHH